MTETKKKIKINIFLKIIKFDTGSNDKICLVSPDSQNIMIVSYAQLKKCFEKVFNEITTLMNT